MASNEPFGFDPEDLDRIFPGASEQLRGALGQFARLLNGSGERAGKSGSAPEPETTGETGKGVWVIYTVAGDGGARVEQAYATELDALRPTSTTPTAIAGFGSSRMELRSPCSTRRRRPRTATIKRRDRPESGLTG